jgi:hypothetical protein
MAVHTVTVGGEQVEVHTMKTSRYGGGWLASTETRWAMAETEQEAIDSLQEILSDDIVTPDNP